MLTNELFKTGFKAKLHVLGKILLSVSINIITGFLFLFYKFIVSITYKNSQFGMKTLLSLSTAILC